ncbi:calcium-transporting ATPase 12, plasma membrane-type-like [Ziziphus jujuba]|uniref:Calcium-transporting ATPase 12, plasma membrane-type-like n=1 Tax=Ziziphus jujuba TaxID=326968 RepID=A0A6P4A3A9_ZIZJJ|nr:calcium-transporting ATPase 12, plasma membrane-type-like [Ziziphus jujuba]
MCEIVVGDVVCLKTGDEVPADGLLVEGNNLQVEDVDQCGETVQVDPDENPFLFYGSIVVNSEHNECKMMVTTVGMKAKWCKMMSQENCDSSENSTVQGRVHNLTLPICLKVSLPIASIGFLVFLIRYFIGNAKDVNGDQEFNHSHLLDFVGTAFTIVAFTIAESLRLSVPVTSFYSKKRMMVNVEMVSELSDRENMAFVTTICTNKTGTLTMNQMEVKKFWVGKYSLEVEAYLSNASNCFKIFLGEGIALNTSSARNCTPTDKAILNNTAFDSQKKRSGVLMKRIEEVDSTVQHVRWKGEADMILEMCSCYYDICGTINDLVDIQKVEFQRIIRGMKDSGLHCITFAHNYVTKGNHKTLKQDGPVLLALVGVKYPCRPEMKEAMEGCQDAGVDVKMITEDDVSAAKDRDRESGILVDPDEDGAVITGEELRGYSLIRRMNEVDKIRVMACSSPEDKLLMVKTLKERYNIIAVSGYSTNDVLASLEAHIGISMGIRGMTKKLARKASFELTLNLAALAIFFLSTGLAGEIPLNSTLVLWLNLIINTQASMALTTEKPSHGIEKKIHQETCG